MTRRDRGLTLLECVIAILVVNLALAMLAAPLVLVAATRLRNDRINQATEIARGEIDQLRVLMEQGVNVRSTSTAMLPPASTVGDATLGNAAALSRQAPPQAIATCTLPLSATTACERELNNSRFAVQIYRGELTTTNSGLVLGYPVQVRVYNADAVPVPDGLFPPGQPIEQATATMTSGGPASERRPLVVLTTEIVRADAAETLSYLKPSKISQSIPQAAPLGGGSPSSYSPSGSLPRSPGLGVASGNSMSEEPPTISPTISLPAKLGTTP
ncbi:MAG: hypothetical protein KatS3mg067_1391 [Thermosynechococcus sp.]|uniref:hypothetical protein n=1 Tax=Thermosynechococcus sp. TaxID=2814275 RepID=UPI002209E0CE|nr:hypothetical protein [Thermosynechococcus sp.]BCX12453.1 MAG: hypothetical protein KatS3mg067_1391 [Thermosynechococcus sp.]